MTLIADGDSIPAGAIGGAVNAWPAKLAAMREMALTNRAVSGAMAGDRAFAGLGFTPNAVDKYAIQIGTNDERTYQADAVRKAFWPKCAAAMILQFALPVRAFPRSWAAGWGNTAVTSGGRASNVLGQKLTSPANVVTGNVLYVGVLTQNAANAGGQTIVRVDGVQVAVIDSSGVGAQTALGLAWPLAAFRIPLATSGQHTVEFEQAASGKMQYIEWVAGNEQASKPEVYVGNIIRSNGYNAGGSDAIVTDYNATLAALIDDLRADGLKIKVVDIHAVIDLTDLADPYHPTSAGQIKIANAFDVAMTADSGEIEPPNPVTITVTYSMFGRILTLTIDSATQQVLSLDIS